MQTDSKETAVLNVIQAWGDSFCNRDIDRMMSLYAKDFVLYDAIPPFFEASEKDYREKLEGCLPYFPEKFGIESRDERVFVDGNIAFVNRLCRWLTEDPDHPAGQSWLRHTCGLKSVDGEWLIVHEHCSVPFDPESMKALLTLDI